MRRLATAVLLFAVVAAALELSSRAGLAVIGAVRGIVYQPIPAGLTPEQRQVLEELLDRRNRYYAYHPIYGWTVAAGGQSELYHASAQGIRAEREFDPEGADDRVRIAAFGDSFTHADDVPNEATWEAVLESLDPRLEVLNFGVSGFGPDQAYLRYRLEGVRYHPDVVLLGFMSENINRLVNTFRPFYIPNTSLPLAKPRFELEDGRLVLVPNPIPHLSDYAALREPEPTILDRLGEHDYFYRHRLRASRLDALATVRLARLFSEEVSELADEDAPLVDGHYNTGSEAFRIASALIDQFEEEAQANGSIPVIVLFPYIDDVQRVLAGEEPAYAPLEEYLEDRGYRYLDLAPVIAELTDSTPLSEVYVPHFSPDANRVVAKTVRDYLEGQGLLQS